MTQAPLLPLLQHQPGLDCLPKPLLERLQQEAQIRRYAIGQPLSFANQLPSEVLLIVEGQARLLARAGGSWLTLDRLGPGSWVGLASLLRAGGCEEVSAAEPLVAVAIPDALALDLIGEDGFYRAACAGVFSAELVALLQHLLAQDAARGRALPELFAELRPRAHLVEPVSGTVPACPDAELWMASCNGRSQGYGTAITPGDAAPDCQGPLPPRLMALPRLALAEPAPPEVVQSVAASGIRLAAAAAATSSLVTPAQEVEPAPLPLASGLDLTGERNQRFRLIRAHGVLEEMLACFQMVALELKLPFRRDAVEKIVRDVLRRGQTPDLQLCGQLASMLGLHVSGARVAAAQGTRLQTPALVRWKEGFAVLRASHAGGLLLACPRDGWVELTPDQIVGAFPDGIELLLLERTVHTPEQRFGPSWFWPAIQRYRGVLIQVLLASFVVQLFGLAGPLLIQVIIDKVISQRSLDTLQVLGLALVVVTLLEGVLGALRTFLFTETTNRIDLRLGSEVIDHLLRLPLRYFDRRPVGELGTRVGELEKIRSFLTGQALSTVLDAVLSVVYIVVMLAYSWLLTLIALGVLPIQIALTLLGAPLFRRQFRDAAKENARTQSHLVEVLSGIQTVKAQNIELISRWKWQDSYAKYIARTFEKTVTGTALTETSQVLQKLSQLLVLWVGATLVLKAEMSLGQLIAFRIISGYVTQPLLRLSSIWQSIQELKVSFERLADVVDTPQESDEADKGKIPLPPIEGSVRFEKVTFAFERSQPAVLHDVSLEIGAGTFMGVVGQSGSGKSTLTKMLSRLYAPDQGRIEIDGYDIGKVELYSLRRQIGIVPQEPLLFSGTVSENIAMGDPEASSEAIVEAARMACAHDFIMEMPAGYSSDVGERGSGLSGGQRQRIALARTLLLKPRLLVLDEATSALDYDTEWRVCQNLLENLRHCTVFFITHRLSTVKRADRIVMMHQGAVVEQGSHEELMAMRGRYYTLFRQQDAA